MTADDSNDARLPWRKTASGIVISVRLTPKSSRDAVVGTRSFSDGRVVLAARVRAMPDKNKANAALVKLLAGWLGLPAGNVEILSGHTSRLKTVSVSGEPAQLALTLQSRMNDLDSGQDFSKGA